MWTDMWTSQKQKLEEQIVSFVEVDAMLIASAKIPEREGGMSPTSFFGHLQTLISLIYQADEFFFWFLVAEQNKGAAWIKVLSCFWC